jgi:hypothetical protein
MKQLNTLATLAAAIEKDLNTLARNRSQSKSVKSSTLPALLDTPKDTDTLSSLRARVSELKATIAQMSRPLLDDEQREHVVTNIILGLKSEPFEMGAKLATHTYNKNWFDNEPDKILRVLLATALLDNFGKSAFAAKTFWNTYANN